MIILKPPSFKNNFFNPLELKSDPRVKYNENKGKYGNVEDIVVFKLNSYHFYIASCSRNVEITLAHPLVSLYRELTILKSYSEVKTFVL